jgi:hypothetical protein
MSTSLTTADFASLAGISERKARHAFARALDGKPWRGTKLTIETVAGRGGRAGQSYVVLAASLPADLQQRLKAHFAIVEHPVSRIADRSSAKHNWFSLILSPALAHPPRSSERRAAIEAIVSRPHTDWNGKPKKLSTRTVERWLAAYDLKGARAFVRHSRRDKNTNRVAISKAWDGAVSLDPITRSRIAGDIRKYVRGLLAKDTSRTVVKTLANHQLRELTVAASADGANELPPKVFELPRRFIDVEKKYRKVAIFDKNRKAHEDAKPRVLRTIDGLQPNEIIVGDVHHLDIVMRRQDGSEAWPKAIAWLDQATKRIWLDLVLLDKGEGIRNADVIASFIRMVTAWGMPQSLYLDNGSEYRWPEFVDDALKLVARIDYNFEDRNSQVIRAKRYNASAKTIEGIFGILERRYFNILPGWAGGDRTNKRTHQVGKPTEPFPGALDSLGIAIGNCLALYHMKPQIGALKGLSPNQKLEAAIQAGWERVTIDVRQLCTVFATDEPRTPRQGCIHYAGEKWTCRELQAFQGDRIIIRAPKFEQPTVLPLLDPVTRTTIGYATRAIHYSHRDLAGAREAAAMDRASRDGIRELRANTPDIDPYQEIVRLVSAQPIPSPAPVAGTISISDEAAEHAHGIAETPAERRNRQQEAAAKIEVKENDRIKKLARKLLPGKSA